MRYLYFIVFCVFLAFIAWSVNDVREMYHTMYEYKIHFDEIPQN